jgi:hypothetical protein
MADQHDFLNNGFNANDLLEEVNKMINDRNYDGDTEFIFFDAMFEYGGNNIQTRPVFEALKQKKNEFKQEMSDLMENKGEGTRGYYSVLLSASKEAFEQKDQNILKQRINEYMQQYDEDTTTTIMKEFLECLSNTIMKLWLGALGWNRNVNEQEPQNRVIGQPIENVDPMIIEEMIRNFNVDEQEHIDEGDL